MNRIFGCWCELRLRLGELKERKERKAGYKGKREKGEDVKEKVKV